MPQTKLAPQTHPIRDHTRLVATSTFRGGRPPLSILFHSSRSLSTAVVGSRFGTDDAYSQWFVPPRVSCGRCHLLARTGAPTLWGGALTAISQAMGKIKSGKTKFWPTGGGFKYFPGHKTRMAPFGIDTNTSKRFKWRWEVATVRVRPGGSGLC